MSTGNIRLDGARFHAAAHLRRQWPAPGKPEVAFAGRSNVGKSSAINVIVNRRGLARTSKTPGRTREIVFFELDSGERLVDLPGYGYAKAPLTARRHWQKTVTEYLKTRETLRALILPMDVRRPLTPLDRQMLDWCDAFRLPAHVLLTKADKLGRGRASDALAELRKELRGSPVVGLQLFSASTRQGVEAARDAIVAFLEDPVGEKNPGDQLGRLSPGCQDPDSEQVGIPRPGRRGGTRRIQSPR